jgi:hypothetical protein
VKQNSAVAPPQLEYVHSPFIVVFEPCIGSRKKISEIYFSAKKPADTGEERAKFLRRQVSSLSDFSFWIAKGVIILKP